MSLFMKNDKMLRALRIYGFLISIWPLEDKADRLRVISYKILLCIYLLNDFYVLPALIRGISYYRNDFGNMTKSILELTNVLDIIISVIYCTVQEKRFRTLLAELECTDDKRSSPYEEILRRKSMFYLRLTCFGLLVIFFMSGGTYIFSPLLEERYFPLNTIFSLPMSETWTWYFIYAQNVFTIMQVSLVVCIDIIIITVLWNATFKFQLLGMQMRSVFTITKLRAAIDAHQNVLDYAQESGSIISFFIVKTIVIIFVNSISSSLLILYDMPLWEMTQFIFIIFLSFIRFYIVCWAAELMTNMAYEISWHIYDTPWMYATPSVRRIVCMIIQRCQKSVTVKATPAIPMICINFCGKVVSVAFSYFLTLRTILHDRI